MNGHPAVIGKYSIIRHLGSGQFGNVYQAHDRALDAQKAIKVLNVADPTTFMAELEEAQLLNRCKHKNIVAVNEADVYDVAGQMKVIIDMEDIATGSLESRVASEFVAATEAIEWMIEALFGLQHAHDQNVLHRDIKPANIMLCGNCAKLSDFGLATRVHAGMNCSPTGYTTHLAPEVFNLGTTNVQTDVYALGITLFRIVSNWLDWNDMVFNLKNCDEKLRTGKVVSALGYPDYVPAKIRRIINKACNADPAKRYQSATEMQQALNGLEKNVAWKRLTRTRWSGVAIENACEYEIEVQQRRQYHVQLLKNGRRQSSQCGRFDSEQEALSHVHGLVCSSCLQ
jgi:serine/threonine-protein kinase